MKMKMLAAMAVSSILAASIANADPAMNGNMNDNMAYAQGPTQLADNGASSNGAVSGAPAMSGTTGGNMSGTSSNNMSGTTGNNMSGTTGGNMSGTSSNNMSGTPNNNMSSGNASPSDEGGVDTATGDDY